MISNKEALKRLLKASRNKEAMVNKQAADATFPQTKPIQGTNPNPKGDMEKLKKKRNKNAFQKLISSSKPKEEEPQEYDEENIDDEEKTASTHTTNKLRRPRLGRPYSDKEEDELGKPKRDKSGKHGRGKGPGKGREDGSGYKDKEEDEGDEENNE